MTLTKLRNCGTSYKESLRPFPKWCVEMFKEHQTVIGTHRALQDLNVSPTPSAERCQMCEFKFANGTSKREHMRSAHRIQIG